MNTRHTPGPWRVECLPVDPDNWAICGSDTASTCRTIGSVDAKHPAAEANARLIASAPDLLVALQVLVSAIDGRERRTGQTQMHPGVDSARAAIAKAVGP